MNVKGTDIRVGDTIEVWWQSRRDTITELRPYTGPIKELHGGFLAAFAILSTGMTIEPNSWYEVVHRMTHSSLVES